MDDRERQSAKLITQLQTVTEKFSVADRQRDTLEATLEDTNRSVFTRTANATSIN